MQRRFPKKANRSNPFPLLLLHKFCAFDDFIYCLRAAIPEDKDAAIVAAKQFILTCASRYGIKMQEYTNKDELLTWCERAWLAVQKVKRQDYIERRTAGALDPVNQESLIYELTDIFIKYIQ